VIASKSDVRSSLRKESARGVILYGRKHSRLVLPARRSEPSDSTNRSAHCKDHKDVVERAHDSTLGVCPGVESDENQGGWYRRLRGLWHGLSGRAAGEVGL
jgi:hypothetical protein